MQGHCPSVSKNRKLSTLPSGKVNSGSKMKEFLKVGFIFIIIQRKFVFFNGNKKHFPLLSEDSYINGHKNLLRTNKNPINQLVLEF